MYADDVALTCSNKLISVVENTISADLELVKEHYHKWHLQKSAKSVSSFFHLKNHLAQYKLKVNLSGNSILFHSTPKYLGITVDCSLTYRHHLTNLKSKMTSRLGLIKRLVGLDWGASFRVLQTSALARLVLAPADYCAPIWTQSAHTQKLNTPFNEALRTISVCLRSTRTNFLLVLAGIEPLKDCHRNACEKLFQLADNNI